MHFFALFFFGLGDSAKQPAGRNSQKNTEKLGDIPNPKKTKRKSALFRRVSASFLSLTPNTTHPHTPISLNSVEKINFIRIFLYFGKMSKKNQIF